MKSATTNPQQQKGECEHCKHSSTTSTGDNKSQQQKCDCTQCGCSTSTSGQKDICPKCQKCSKSTSKETCECQHCKSCASSETSSTTENPPTLGNVTTSITDKEAEINSSSRGGIRQKIQEVIQSYTNPATTDSSVCCSNKSKYSDTEKMKALAWQGSSSVALEERPKPIITDPKDAIVRITAVTICGSDLHLYTGELSSATYKGDILGHEGVGIVESVGPEVRNVKPGDRVVISFNIACGTCEYCRREEFSSCNCTNPSSMMQAQYGHRTAGLFGYSHLTGGFDGLQAEFARVPFADVNLFVVPPETKMKDEFLILLSDIACTGWHGTECANVKKGDDVAIWGAGPVGLMAAMWSKFRGAHRVVVIDNEEYRLNVAKEGFGCEVINFDKLESGKTLTDTLMDMFPTRGLDCCIECVGFRFPSTWLHKIERTLGIESDTSDIIDQMTMVTRKWGRIALIGDYFGYGNHFPIGRIMEKSINMLGGQALPQKYWKTLFEHMQKGEVNPAPVITHVLPFEQIVEGYKVFNKHEDNALKIVLKTGMETKKYE